ncbi:MAG: fused MFS/spermidine synthase [Planctomycetota bacterium]
MSQSTPSATELTASNAALKLRGLGDSLSDRLHRKSMEISIYWFATAILMGAFLVFQVQPIVSKIVLPWFGGTPAVWSTCLLFFQLVLFGGYLYAHLLKTFLTPRTQALVHCSLLLLAVGSLPIEPSTTWKPTGSENPTWYLMQLLAVHVGLPYFVLSATGPLVQAWLSYHDQSNRVYRLYALSNIGSLTALLSYPFLIEPWLSVSSQSLVWSLIMGGFSVVLGLVATTLMGKSNDHRTEAVVDANSTGSDAVTWNTRLAWLALPAFASVLLMNVTSHVCTDVAVVPFLWVCPLSLYLLSFIIAFDSPSWYRPKLIAAIGLAALWLTYQSDHLPIDWQMIATVVFYMVFLLAMCLLCHGEAARLKPPPSKLTEFYLMLSAGGALGGLIVAVLCPILLDNMFEIAASIYLAQAFGLIVLLSARGWGAPQYAFKRVALFNSAIVLFASIQIINLYFNEPEKVVESQRNFFGELRVEKLDDRIQLVHGRTIHGAQAFSPREMEPTSYYGRTSGVGLAMKATQARLPSARIGIVGLGCGVLTTYGRLEDRFDMYEINPAVIDLAERHFSFLSSCPSEQHMHVGDGRLLLERHAGEPFDLLVLDAFSSDAIPAHLLTCEAMSLYGKCLTKKGILAIHVSNNHLDLAPLVHRLAQSVGMTSLKIDDAGDHAELTQRSQWVLLSYDPDVISGEDFDVGSLPEPSELADAPLWTDQYHNLLSVLKVF